jgi:predicted O-methyltransferase YrrM
MNSRDSLEKAVESLCARLRPGGLLLADDRFHGGWKKRMPGDGLKRMLSGYGLKTLTGIEGVAGVKPGRV